MTGSNFNWPPIKALSGLSLRDIPYFLQQLLCCPIFIAGLFWKKNFSRVNFLSFCWSWGQWSFLWKWHCSLASPFQTTRIGMNTGTRSIRGPHDYWSSLAFCYYCGGYLIMPNHFMGTQQKISNGNLICWCWHAWCRWSLQPPRNQIFLPCIRK